LFSEINSYEEGIEKTIQKRTENELIVRRKEGFGRTKAE
jgi:hypothetical protein